MNEVSKVRTIEEVLSARATSDGDGVQLQRVFGGGDLSRFDPFLMLDEFGSDKPSDYIGGFPPHPHRGFETVTYMLDGHMEHKDHMGNVGRLQSGDVQWMKAGAGVIHSEMPKQEEGLMRGFQLWVNLPAAEKMTPASYQDIGASEIPTYTAGAVEIKAIAGKLAVNDMDVTGVVTDLSTDAGYLDLNFSADDTVDISIPNGYTSLIYVYEGEAKIAGNNYSLGKGKFARLSRDGNLPLQAVAGSRVLVMTGKVIGEAIVQQGPFVMNTEEEIQQAIRDYSSGTLV